MSYLIHLRKLDGTLINDEGRFSNYTELPKFFATKKNCRRQKLNQNIVYEYDCWGNYNHPIVNYKEVGKWAREILVDNLTKSNNELWCSLNLVNDLLKLSVFLEDNYLTEDVVIST